MPTGYTADVQSGKVTELSQFAMQCARAFGACVTMRDDPSDAEIPQAFMPSSYHTEALQKNRDDLKWFQEATAAEVQERCDKEFQEAHESWVERGEQRRIHRERYEAMLQQIQAWQAPSPDHEEMKRFMESQIAESIRFDCSASYDDAPCQVGSEQWRAEQIKRLMQSISYHADHQLEEEQRAAKRTLWVKQLRESLQPVTA